jgi:hypothetical protein
VVTTTSRSRHLGGARGVAADRQQLAAPATGIGRVLGVALGRITAIARMVSAIAYGRCGDV